MSRASDRMDFIMGRGDWADAGLRCNKREFHDGESPRYILCRECGSGPCIAEEIERIGTQGTDNTAFIADNVPKNPDSKSVGKARTNHERSQEETQATRLRLKTGAGRGPDR